MIPRTVQMTKEVAAQFTTLQEEAYGNILLNGYRSTVPNTTNKKAWQYKETTAAPVNLPSLSIVQPALKGWTTNYQEYYTELPVNAYGVNPGDPTMFQYVVHSFTPLQAPIKEIFGFLSNGIGYTPGVYTNVATTTNGSGTGATVNVTVTSAPGKPTAVSIFNSGEGYPISTPFTGADTYTLVGSGTGLKLNGTTNSVGGISTVTITPGSTGIGYQVNDIVQVEGGSAQVLITSVSTAGVVTSMSLANPGTGYAVNDVLYPVLSPGSGAGIQVTAVNLNSISGGGEPRWSQPPRRLINATVSNYVPPNSNGQAIQYSAILYPSTM